MLQIWVQNVFGHLNVINAPRVLTIVEPDANLMQRLLDSVRHTQPGRTHHSFKLRRQRDFVVQCELLQCLELHLQTQALFVHSLGFGLYVL